MEFRINVLKLILLVKTKEFAVKYSEKSKKKVNKKLLCLKLLTTHF